MDGNTVITVGNFDGVHCGHQAMLRRARWLADQHGAQVVAVTFADHPQTVLKPTAVPPILMDRESALALLAEQVDRIQVLSLERELLKQTPEQFVAMMVEQFAPVAWVEGENFRFGRHRRGDVRTLRAEGERRGFAVEVVPIQTMTLRDKTQAPVSSSLIRWLVGRGRMADASQCLGRPFGLRGEVVAGAQRGRTLGVPTANLDCGRQILPGAGVYGGRCTLDRTYLAAVSIGGRPTFGEADRPACEVHLLDFDGDLYGRTVEVQVLRWVRDQQTFSGAAALADQLQRDLHAVRSLEAAGLLDPAATVCSRQEQP